MKITHFFASPSPLTLKAFSEKVDERDNQGVISKIFKKSFSEEITDLKALKKSDQKYKNYYSRVIYHKVLNKIIDLIGEEQYLLKNEAKVPHSNKRPFSIAELNSCYQKYFKKYSELPKEIPLHVLFQNPTYFIQSCNFLEPQAFEQKKKLADIGYSIVQELDKWLQASVSDGNETFEGLIVNFTEEFLTWADTHPKAASALIFDVAFTGSILLDAPEGFLNALDAMITSRLFFDALGLSPEYEEVEDQALLKFRALADLASYCPRLATAYSITKKTIRGDFHSLSGWILNAIKETAVTEASQKIAHLVPKGKEKIVSCLIDLVRGKEIQDILVHQRDLALIQMGGAIRQVIKNNDSFSLFFEIWWKTVFEAEGEERKNRMVTQIIMPFLSLSLLISLCFAKFLGFYPTFFPKISVFTALSASLIPLSFLLTRAIDEQTQFKSRNKVEKEIRLREKQFKLRQAHYFISTDKEMKEAIEREATIHICNLKKYYVIGVPIIKSNDLIGKENKDLFIKIKGKHLHRLNKAATKYHQILTEKESITIFNEVIDLKKIRNKLAFTESKSADAVINCLVQDLIKEWLQPAIERAIKFKLVYLYEMDKKGYKAKHSPSFSSLKKYFTSKAEEMNNPYQKNLYIRTISKLNFH